MSLSAASDDVGRPLATWQTKRPWLWAILVGIGGTVLTAFGVGFSQARHLDPVSATYAQAAFVGLSALVGLAVMWRTRPSLAEYGFRSPLHLDRALWLLPLFAVPVVVVALVGITVTPAQAAAYVALAVCVGFSEEIWFRGLLLASLRRLGTRKAIIGGSTVFGALHLTNFFAGLPPLYLGLQFVFACLVGFVLAELVAITGSLWLLIGWHAVYDLAAFSTGEDLTPAALVGLAVATAILAAYAFWLWRKLPSDAPVVELED
jgi:membrane protease YdiL (CAAX protease family)